MIKKYAKERQVNLARRIQEWAYTYLNNKNYHYWSTYLELKKSIPFPPPDQDFVEKSISKLSEPPKKTAPVKNRGKKKESKTQKHKNSFNSLKRSQNNENIGKSS